MVPCSVLQVPRFVVMLLRRPSEPSRCWAGRASCCPFHPISQHHLLENRDQFKPIYLKPGREEGAEIQLLGQRFIPYKTPCEQRVC